MRVIPGGAAGAEASPVVYNFRYEFPEPAKLELVNVSAAWAKVGSRLYHPPVVSGGSYEVLHAYFPALNFTQALHTSWMVEGWLRYELPLEDAHLNNWRMGGVGLGAPAAGAWSSAYWNGTGGTRYNLVDDIPHRGLNNNNVNTTGGYYPDVLRLRVRYDSASGFVFHEWENSSGSFTSWAARSADPGEFDGCIGAMHARRTGTGRSVGTWIERLIVEWSTGEIAMPSGGGGVVKMIGGIR